MRFKKTKHIAPILTLLLLLGITSTSTAATSFSDDFKSYMRNVGVILGYLYVDDSLRTDDPLNIFTDAKQKQTWLDIHAKTYQQIVLFTILEIRKKPTNLCGIYDRSTDPHDMVINSHREDLCDNHGITRLMLDEVMTDQYATGMKICKNVKEVADDRVCALVIDAAFKESIEFLLKYKDLLSNELDLTGFEA